MNTPRVFVLGVHQVTVQDWCIRNKVKPFARSTVLVTRNHNLRGHTFQEGDRVVIIGGVSGRLLDCLRMVWECSPVQPELEYVRAGR